MNDPREQAEQRADTDDDAPRLETEPLKDLTPADEQADDVRGGITTAKDKYCEVGTA